MLFVWLFCSIYSAIFSKRYVPPAMIVVPPMIPMINGAITVIPSVSVYVGFF